MIIVEKTMNVRTICTGLVLSLLVPQLSWAQSAPPPGPVDPNYPSLFTPVPGSSQPGSNAPAPRDCLTESQAAEQSQIDQKEKGARMIQPGSWEEMLQGHQNYMNAGAAAARQQRVADDVCSRNRSDFIQH
jgi:hypothetical protein